MRTVNIRGTVEMQGATSRIMWYEPVRLKFTFFEGYDEDLPEFPVVLQAQDGVFAGKVELDKAYEFARIEPLDTMYGFISSKKVGEGIERHTVRDTVLVLDSIQVYKQILPANLHLVRIKNFQSAQRPAPIQ